MRRILIGLAWLGLLISPAEALSPAQVAVVTPAYQAPGWTSWTPASLGAALKGEWTADGLSDGAVTTWTDSVSSVAPTQGSASLRPVKAPTSYNATVNGKPGVTCDGSDDFLRTTTNISLLPTGSTAGEEWLAADYLSGVAVAGNKFFVTYGTSGASLRQILRTNQTVKSAAVIGEGATNLNDNLNVDVFGPHVMQGEWSGMTERGSIDGRPFAATSATIAPLNTGTTAMEICANIVNASPANLVVHRIEITTDLSADDEARMAAYLAWEGGTQFRLPYNHPYRNRAP